MTSLALSTQIFRIIWILDSCSYQIHTLFWIMVRHSAHPATLSRLMITYF